MAAPARWSAGSRRRRCGRPRRAPPERQPARPLIRPWQGRGWRSGGPLALAVTVALAGCDVFTDPATRLAFDLEAAAARLSPSAGTRAELTHRTPSRRGECTGPYTVQLDQAGAIVVWCRD